MSPVRLLSGLLLAVLLPSGTFAQDAADADLASIRELVYAFMKEEKFPQWKEAYTGEMRLFGSRPTPGAAYSDDRYEATIRVNQRDETSAAVAVAMAEKGAKQTDFYLFLRKIDDTWKIAAVKTFAPPRGMGQMYAALAAKGKDVTPGDMRDLGIMQALQFHDAGLKQMLKDRRERLEAIASTLSRKGINETIHGSNRSSRIDKALWQQVHDSGLNYVEQREDGVIDFNSASFAESAVGYFYVPEGAQPPQATPDDYIVIEQIDGPWYLYRKQ